VKDSWFHSLVSTSMVTRFRQPLVVLVNRRRGALTSADHPSLPLATMSSGGRIFFPWYTSPQLGDDVFRGRFVRQRGRNRLREILAYIVSIFVTVFRYKDVPLSATHGLEQLRGAKHARIQPASRRNSSRPERRAKHDPYRSCLFGCWSLAVVHWRVYNKNAS